jgi:hypothetical protein
LEFDIDFEFLVDLYNQQNGLCAYSNLPLQFGSYKENNWKISLERIDVRRGYTKDNVCLICFEFQAIDHSARYLEKPESSTGWSKEKFKLFKDSVMLKLNF